MRGGGDVNALGVHADHQPRARQVNVTRRALHHGDHTLGRFFDVLRQLRSCDRGQGHADDGRDQSEQQACHSRPLSHLNTAVASPHRYSADPQNRLTPCRACSHSSHVGIRLIWLTPRPTVMPCTVP